MAHRAIVRSEYSTSRRRTSTGLRGDARYSRMGGKVEYPSAGATERLGEPVGLLEDRMDEPFEPQIVAFCCHYCAYAAADMAGSLRLSYPPNVKVIEVPCSGRVDVLHILHAFEQGADGVFVAG